MHARADLRARADQRMRINHRSLADPRADVHVHRRHADHAWRQIRAVADRGAARHDPNARLRARVVLPDRQRVLVEKLPEPLDVRQPHIDRIAELETEQDPLLDPGVHAPAERAGRIGLGGANRSRRERLAQLRKRRARPLAIRGGSRRNEFFDGRLHVSLAERLALLCTSERRA